MYWDKPQTHQPGDRPKNSTARKCRGVTVAKPAHSMLLIHPRFLFAFYPLVFPGLDKSTYGVVCNLGKSIMKKSTIASLIGLAFATPIFAAENFNLDDVVVKANRIEHKDTETTYASEIHTSKQIEDSGAATLYDFLAQHSSLNILSNYGNKATPSINLRGFGGENGAQNIVITLDGQRLNNVDGQAQLLGAIPLSSIDKIEISKGSGSVIYGDGATAGTMQIYSKRKTGVTAGSSFGSDGQQNHSINAGVSNPHFDLSANLAHDSHDGFGEADSTGSKDAFVSNTQNAQLKIKPTDSLRILLAASSSKNDVRYVSPMTLAQFNANAKQAPLTSEKISPYTHQLLDTEQWRAGFEYDLSNQLTLKVRHFKEDKRSDYVNFSSQSNYDYDSNDIELSYHDQALDIVSGIQTFNGSRTGASNKTSKDNQAAYIQGEYRPTWFTNQLTLAAGARHEKIHYNYSPFSGGALNADEQLNAIDIGFNYRLSTAFTMFFNINHAYQAPDIDRFFNFGGTFNGFITPAKSKSFNLGFNHSLSNNQLKLTAFRVNLNNEIYYNSNTFTNTNIDKSHKIGFEIQDNYQANRQASVSILYNYTKAIIDEENDGAGTFNGRNLPGAPKQAAILNLNYQLTAQAHINFNHTWRSVAYAYNDFFNTAAQRQAHYESTNIALNYQYRNLQFFSAISNLFEYKNSIQVADDSIYPVDFVRTWRLGLKADF